MLTGDEVKTDYDTNQPLPPDPKPVGLRRRELWQQFRAFLLAGAALTGLGRLVTPAPPDPRREAVRARVAMLEAERALEALAAAEAAGSGAAEARGLFTHRLAAAYAEAEALYRRHRGLLRAQGGEWPALRADLLALASPAPAEARRASAARVMRSYSIYQQAM